MIIFIMKSKLNIFYVCVFLFAIRTARTLASSWNNVTYLSHILWDGIFGGWHVFFLVYTVNALCQLHGRMIFSLHYCSLLPYALNAAYQQQEDYRNSFSYSIGFVTSNSRLNIFVYDVSPFTIRTERTLTSQGKRRKFLGVTCTFFSIRS